MAKRAPTRSDHLRSAVAQEAARLMAEHGIQDFLTAKRKAAERYGVVEGAFLPKNTEIEAALIERQRLFGASAHEESLARQRRVAIEAMRLLEKFEPRLVGPVLTGTATEHADIQIHVFSDSAESVYFHLFDHHIAHEVIERRVKMNAERQLSVPGLRIEQGPDSVEVLIFARDGIRQAPVSPVDGRPMRRANLGDVLDLAGMT